MGAPPVPPIRFVLLVVPRERLIFPADAPLSNTLPAASTRSRFAAELGVMLIEC